MPTLRRARHRASDLNSAAVSTARNSTCLSALRHISIISKFCSCVHSENLQVSTFLLSICSQRHFLNLLPGRNSAAVTTARISICLGALQHITKISKFCGVSTTRISTCLSALQHISITSKILRRCPQREFPSVHLTPGVLSICSQRHFLNLLSGGKSAAVSTGSQREFQPV